MKSRGLVYDLGFSEYKTSWDIQRRLVEARANGLIEDVLILVEHPHVLTLGRKGDLKNILSDVIPTHHVERGGDVTYHGPGQIVGYPILKLDDGRLDLHRYLRNLEEVLIQALAEWGIKAERSLQTGVWVNGKKIASIGIAVSRWVSYHGFALNANTDLSYFALIRPCGLESETITSMQKVLGRRIEEIEVKKAIIKRFSDVFEMELLESEQPLAAMFSEAQPSTLVSAKEKGLTNLL